MNRRDFLKRMVAVAPVAAVAVVATGAARDRLEIAELNRYCEGLRAMGIEPLVVHSRTHRGGWRIDRFDEETT